MTATTTIFTSQQLSRVNTKLIPLHVAIIPDGNRRWARNQVQNTEMGHREGASNLIEIVKAAKELGIKALTFYLFSTENWSRSPEEINALMWLLQEFLIENCSEMQSEGISLKTIGDLNPLSGEVQTVIKETKNATEKCNKIDMILALNYGGRNEICRAIHSIIDDCNSKKISKEQITESLIANYLDTNSSRDPDLLIRTSGEMRISNFLLWQLSYTEIYFVDVLWPDFKPNNLIEAIEAFQKRERRLGGP